MASNAAMFPRSLRGAASIFTVTAASLMLSAHQTAIYADSSVHVTFGDLTPYWCFVFANGLAATYGFLVIWLPSKSLLWMFVVAVDPILIVILSSSCSASLAAGLIERNGNIHARCGPIYHLVPSYCLRILSATAFGFLAVLIYLFLHLRSIQAEFNSILVDI